ncbi:MAG: HD domain-containing protein [Bacteroidota bacterium]
MTEAKKLQFFNDPIYGFIGTPNELVYQLIGHPYFQRLRRISQMGMSYLVYPGAHQSRFHHALGSMHLMTKAIGILRQKGVAISQTEESGLLCAILLHDVGHGPFSHALEGFLLEGVSHEALSLQFMEALNSEFDGALDVAIAIFKGEYPRIFMNQLVSSQLDMDRLDYLKRDSFYSGVTEGNINSERLISMLNVKDDQIVVEEKGIYAVEKFLMARTFMYWQVYLHKTSLAAEQMLIRIMQRAKTLLLAGIELRGGERLSLFLQSDAISFPEEHLENFALLDDTDILFALKQWQFAEDKVLSILCSMLLERRLLHVKMKNKPFDAEKLFNRKQKVSDYFGLTHEETDYLMFQGHVSHTAYNPAVQPITILRNSGKLISLVNESDHFGPKALSKSVSKYYCCYPKFC